MIKLIQAACQRGQKDFGGWVIGRARYCLRNWLEPVPCESTPKKVTPGYVLLEATAYDAGRPLCRFLEICLVDINVLRNIGNIKEARYMPGQLTMTFLPEGLKSFLSASGDIDPVHYGPNAITPGLRVFSRLEELYGSHRPVETFSIRFLHPVHVGGSVRLIHKNNMVTGTVGNTAYFTVTVHLSNQT